MLNRIKCSNTYYLQRDFFSADINHHCCFNGVSLFDKRIFKAKSSSEAGHHWYLGKLGCTWTTSAAGLPNDLSSPSDALSKEFSAASASAITGSAASRSRVHSS